MRHTIHLSRMALLILGLALASCSNPVQQALQDAAARTVHVGGPGDHHGNSALFFNGVDANTSTPQGTLLTTQIDDISYDAIVRYDGPNAADNHQMIVYNGHGAVTGWGILVLGPPDGAAADGTLAILAGGITIDITPLVLTVHKWQHVHAERRAGVVTISLDGQEFNDGSVPVNPVAAAYASIERTSVGGDGTFDAPTGDFHGAIDNVSVRDLAGEKLIERWGFNEGRGTTTTGVNGTVLYLGTTSWVSSEERHDGGGQGNHDGDKDQGDNGHDNQGHDNSR